MMHLLFTALLATAEATLELAARAVDIVTRDGRESDLVRDLRRRNAELTLRNEELAMELRAGRTIDGVRVREMERWRSASYWKGGN